MKTLGRTFIILFAFVLLSGLMVTAVNASGMNQPDFDDGRTEFRPQGGHEEGGRGERGGGGFGWIFGAIKNVGVISVLVVLIALPRSITKNKKRTATAP